MSESRSVMFNMFIGYNRTGKSSVGKYYGNLWRINNPWGECAGYDPQGRFRHLIDPKLRLRQGEKRMVEQNKAHAQRTICSR